MRRRASGAKLAWTAAIGAFLLCVGGVALMALRDTREAAPTRPVAPGPLGRDAASGIPGASRMAPPIAAPANAERATPSRDPQPSKRADASLHGLSRSHDSLILGTLIDESAAPIAGAEVALFDRALHGPGPVDLAQAPAPVARTTTDEDGRFHFAAHHGDPHGVAVLAEGFVPRSSDRAPGEDTPLELQLATEIIGRVSSNGRGRADVEIQLPLLPHWNGEQFAALKRTVSSIAGTFSFSGVSRERRITLHVAAPGAFPFAQSLRTLDAPQTAIEIALESSSEWGGLVLGVERIEDLKNPDAKTEALLGATLRVGLSDPPRWSARTDGEGRYRLRLEGPLSSWAMERAGLSSSSRQLGWHPLIEAYAPGYCRVSTSLDALVPRSFDSDSATQELSPLRLPRAGTLRGLVLGAGDAPIAGARLHWWGTQRPGASRVYPSPDSEFSETDVLGRFELTEIPVGLPQTLLEITTPDGRTRRIEGAAPRSVTQPKELVVRFEGVAVLQLRLMAAGSPCPGRVLVRGSAGSEVHDAPESGRLTLQHLTPGEYTVQVANTSDGAFGEERKVTLESDETVHLAMEVSDARAGISGVVLDANGAGFDGEVNVATYREEGVANRHSLVASTRASADGSFELMFPSHPLQQFAIFINTDESSFQVGPIQAISGQVTDGVELRLPAMTPRTVILRQEPLPNETFTLADGTVRRMDWPGVTDLTWSAPTLGLRGQVPLAPLTELETRLSVPLPDAPLELRLKLVGQEPETLSVTPEDDGPIVFGGDRAR